MGDNTSADKNLEDPLYVASRAQKNFNENIPLALIIAALAELNGANRYDFLTLRTKSSSDCVTCSKYVNYFLGALLAFRISHVEFGRVSWRNECQSMRTGMLTEIDASEESGSWAHCWVLWDAGECGGDGGVSVLYGQGIFYVRRETYNQTHKSPGSILRLW